MKRRGHQGIRRKLAAAAVGACFAAEVVCANPVGPVVVNGQVTFAQAGRLLSITNSPGSIINWQQFSIGPRETTRFIQQSPASAVLNRVVGGDPSAILGTLQSNGRVFLINPNGILFGPGARIDVGGLVASTLRLSDEDFLAGRMNFLADPAQPAAAVVNQGRITAGAGGQVFLVGSAVDNQGLITAPNGDIVLAAGNSVKVTESAGSRLQVEITAPADRSVNLSEALYGTRGLYGGLVRNSGTISADAAVRTADGRVILKASTDLKLEAGSRVTANGARGGTIDAQAESGALVAQGVIEAKGDDGPGGTVHLLADQVALLPGTRVDVSGDKGGGSVLVGGDYQGGNAELKNSTFTFVGSDVTLDADAVAEGNGGKVIVWADDTTRFGGTVSARGGSRGGDGGFVEVSGKDTLVFRGAVDTRAPRGRTGTLLLDPATIVISNGTGESAADGDALNNSFSGAPSGVTGAVAGTDNPAAGTLTLFESELEGIAATTSISLAATGNITINNLADNLLNLAQTAGNSVTFNAGGAFSMTAGDTIRTAGGALNVTAPGGATLGALATAGGAITINVGAAATASGVISGAGTSLTKQGTGTLTLNAANTYTGATTVSAGTLALGANNRIANTSTVVVDGGTLDINTRSDTVGGVQLVSGSITGTTGVLTSSSAYDMRSGAVSAILGGGGIALNKSTGGTVTLSRANTYTGLTTVSAGTLRYGANNALAAGGVTVADGGLYDLAGFSDTIGALTVNSGVTGGSVTTGAGTLTLTGNIASTGGAANASISGNLAFGATRTITTPNAADGLQISAAISGAGGLAKAGAGTVTLSGTNTYTGTTTINAGKVRLSGGNAIVDTGAVALANVASAILDLNGASETIGSLAGGGAVGGNVSLGAATLSTGGNNTSTTYAGAIGGTGGLTKLGTGNLTLTGTSSYDGATTIDAGTLTATRAGALGSAAGGTTVNPGATLALNGTLTWSEPVTLAGGTLARVGGNPTVTGAVDVAADSIVTGAAGTLTLAGDVSGAGALTKTGAGIVVLSGNNMYTGATNINAGTLRVAGGNGIGDASAVNMGGGALALSASTEAIGSLAGTSNVTLGAGTLTTGGNNATTAYSGVISGTGGLTKEGAGAFTLSGNNTYTGATTIGAGTLQLGAANRIANASAVTVAGGAAFNLAGFAETVGSIAGAGDITLGAGTLTAGNATNTTFSGVISGTGAFTKVGTGVLELSGANTHSGLTTVSAGTLAASNASALGSPVGGTTVAAGATLNINNVAIGNEVISLTGNGAGGAGALTGTGIASVAGALTLTGASRIGTTSGVSALTLGGAVNAGGNALDITGAGNLTAANALNNFGTVTANATGDIALVDANALTIGASSVGRLSARTLSGNLTLGGNVTATGSGDTIVLAAAANFVNAGGFSLAPGGSGRWLVYSTSPAGSTEGGLTAAAGSALPRLYNRGFGGSPPASITEPGNHLVYSMQPALAVAPDNKAKVYGSNDPAQTFGAMGFVSDDGVLDTVATAGLTGSFGRVAGETVTAPGPSYAITQGTFTSDAGYSITFDGTRALTITPAALSVAANAQSKTYGAADPTLTFGVAGLASATVTDWNGNGTPINDTAASALGGTLGRAAGETVAGSPHAITQGTLAANPNYSIGTFTGNSLTIVPAPLTITANDASRAANQPNPPFSATYSGFQFGDTPANLAGTLSFSTPAALGSPAGAYAIAPFGQASSNYVFTYVNGTLTISAAPLSSATFVNPLIPAVNSFVPDPQAAPSGAPAVVAMDSSLTLLPATAAGSEEGAEQSAAQPARPFEDTWSCFRSGSIVSRKCR